jgi:SAM-dependent methyltransferase
MLYRKDKIIELCTGKKTLHLGFIQHSHLYEKLINEGTWLHARLNEVCTELVGIDFLREETEKTRDRFGYEVYCVDVTRLEDWEYKGTFDVIVCGELIEHLENPGLMFDGLKRFMDENSILIITTPNPWSRNRLKRIRKKENEADWLNPEHTCWFSYQTLKQLLDRKGYAEVSYDYYYGETEDEQFQTKYSMLNRYLRFKRKILGRMIPVQQHTGLFFQARLRI